MLETGALDEVEAMRDLYDPDASRLQGNRCAGIDGLSGRTDDIFADQAAENGRQFQRVNSPSDSAHGSVPG